MACSDVVETFFRSRAEAAEAVEEAKRGSKIFEAGQGSKWNVSYEIKNVALIHVA